MTRVLFVNNPPRQCGVYNHGLTTADAIRKSTRFEFSYLEAAEETTAEQFLATLADEVPDVIIYNWHNMTMRWVDDDLLAQVRRAFSPVHQLALAHDEPPPYRLLSAIIQIDPTIVETEREFRVRRYVPDYTPTQQPADNVIGWFGFAAKHKGVLRVIEQVNAEFDDAVVRLHIPFNYYGDREGVMAYALADKCRNLAKPGIRVEVTHDYKSTDELIEWLSGNSINCYLYDEFPVTAISSAIDYALAARRPIAVSDSNMFRHILKLCPGTRLSARSLKEIIRDGFAPLDPIRRDWCATHVKEDYERIVAKVMGRVSLRAIQANRVITPGEFESLRPGMEQLRQYEPETTSQKAPFVIAQNAFTFLQLQAIAQKSDDILVVGGYDDPTGPALQKLGYQVRITDPKIDGNEARNLWLESLQQTGQLYDLILACSVLEHVPDDVSFIYHLYDLLKPGGVAFFTAPYQEIEPLEERDEDLDPDHVPRVYDVNRLQNMAKHVPENALLDRPLWEECDLQLAQQPGNFCSLAIRKPVRQDAHELIGPHRLKALIRAMAREMEILENRLHSQKPVPPSPAGSRLQRLWKRPFAGKR